MDNDKLATDFLILTNTIIELQHLDVVDGFPFDEKDTLPHKHYKVHLIHNNKEYVYDFYDSYENFKNNKVPTRYDVLACLEKYDVGDMADFVDEFGYHINDRKSFLRVEKIWHACKDQYKALTEMFTPKEMEMLQEIG